MLKKIIIKNFKKMKDFKIDLNEGLNIIVGNNESGKSTIVEAIYLCMNGVFKGKYVANNISEYLFNKECVSEYIESLSTENKMDLPEILIEVYLTNNDNNNNLGVLKGNENSEEIDDFGLQIKIHFDEEYKSEYEELMKDSTSVKTLPIEYYKVSRCSFARHKITNKAVPFNTLLVDASQQSHKNGSDMYISNIVQAHLEDKETVAIAQAHRKMKDTFSAETAVTDINDKIKNEFPDKNIKVSVDLSTQHSWDSHMMTYVEDIPFHYIGKRRAKHY